MRHSAVLVLICSPMLVTAVSLAGEFGRTFTPVDLTTQADVILEVSVKPGDRPSTVTAEVVRVLKNRIGGQIKGPITIALETSQFKEHAETVAKRIRNGEGNYALLFVGSFKARYDDGDNIGEAFVHLEPYTWVKLHKGKNGRYEMERIDSEMASCWSGGTDMLVRAVEYFLSDPDAHMPQEAGTDWVSQVKAGKIDGKVHAAMPVDLDSGLKQYLFVAAESGDRLFRFDEKSKNLVDLTTERKLASRSRQAVWGDFDGDGRLDLASWDGKTLTLHLQQRDGTFLGKPLEAKDLLRAGCVGLSVFDDGGGQAALLISTPDTPVMLVPGERGAWDARTMPARGATTQPTGSGAACLVADLDGDGLTDILQPFAGGSLLYKRKPGGQFAEPVACAVALGKGQAKAWLGDFDGDGLLDVFAVGEDGCRLWQNKGGGTFAETADLSGDIRLWRDMIVRPRVDGVTCDFNNDGLQDVLIVLGDRAPQLFFNRGFRNLRQALLLDVAAHGLLPEAAKGCQAGCMGDFHGFGVQDMAIVLNNGEVWVFCRRVSPDNPGLSVRVGLQLGGASAGPVAVTATGYCGKRRLGAWNVTAGTSAFVGQYFDSGPITLKWQLPGGKVGQREVQLKDNPVRFMISD